MITSYGIKLAINYIISGSLGILFGIFIERLHNKKVRETKQRGTVQ